MSLRLDDCSHCACVTHLTGYTVERAIADLETRQLGCWNCEDQGGDEPDGHFRCVALRDDEDNVLWDGRHLEP